MYPIVTNNIRMLLYEVMISVWWGDFVHSQKKRYKSCHCGCTFSKGKLLSIL